MHNKGITTLITGPPGSGKTSHLIQSVKLVDNYIVLSPTWANIKRIQQDLPDIHILTISAFNKSCKYTMRKYNNIFIDEFSMINVLQCRNILVYINKFNPNVYIYGDQYQLISIDDGEPSYTSSDIKDIIKLGYNMQTDNIEYAMIKIRSLVDKLHIDKHVELTHIYRTDNIELCKIYLDMRNNTDNYSCIEKYITPYGYIYNNIVQLLDKHNYIIIAGSYGSLNVYYKRYLQCLYEVQEHMFITDNKFESIRIEKDQEYILTDTLYDEQGIDKSSFNIMTNNQKVVVSDVSYECGDRWIEIRCHDVKIKLYEPIPLQPCKFITVHRSQGCEYDRVIIDIFSMFEIGHLYTAITRTKQGLIIVGCDKWKDIYMKQMDMMNKLQRILNIDMK